AAAAGNPRAGGAAIGCRRMTSRRGGGGVTSNGGGEAAAGETQRQQPAPNAWQVLKGVLFRIFIIWAISSWFRRGPAPQEQSSAGGTPRAPSRNLFPKDTLMDLYVYISEHEHFTDFNVSSALFWQKRDLVYGDWTSGENADGCYEHYGEVDISQSVQQNGSIYIHVYFTKSGFHPDPRQKNLYRRLATVHTSRSTAPSRRTRRTKNLLTGETEADPEMIKRAEDYGPVEVISHWHPNLTINMVDDHTPWVKGSVPPPLDQYVKFDAISGDYYPILYFNDYWNLQKDYFPINESLQRLPFRLSFCPLSLWRWQLYAAQSTKSPWNFLGEDLYEQSDEEQDSVKVALLETNPYLLALTIVVSIVHSIFEFLAFKNGQWGLGGGYGFITMTPQLFINYKLQSVAHLPWRMLSYKALNTFIDDLFAFVIRMPIMYRIGCLRDDVVFFIYLYQRWIYRVDPTRVNEFGVSGEQQQQQQQQRVPTPPALPPTPPQDKKKD
uniref:CLPTM1 regulator of GABA type A receptor forward trafficking n=1 Tax=Phasianus colchicus TaxID=9054 RepID=A0A669QLC7_PHACC